MNTIAPIPLDHQDPTMNQSVNASTPIIASGFRRNSPIFAHDIQQWIVNVREPSKFFQLGREILLHDEHAPNHEPNIGIISHIKALEIEWVSFYVSAMGHIVFEISVPVYWAQLPPYRRLEYALLSHTMPTILARSFPAQHYYEAESRRYTQVLIARSQTRQAAISQVISAPQSFSVPLHPNKRQILHRKRTATHVPRTSMRSI